MLDSQKILSKILADGVDPSYFDVCSIGDILMMKTSRNNSILDYYIVTEIYDNYLVTDKYTFYKEDGNEISNKQKDTKITLPIKVFKDIHIKVSTEELDKMKEKLNQTFKINYHQLNDHILDTYNYVPLSVNSASSSTHFYNQGAVLDQDSWLK